MPVVVPICLLNETVISKLVSFRHLVTLLFLFWWNCCGKAEYKYR